MKKAILTISALIVSAMISTGAMATVPDLIPVQGVLADSADLPIDALTDITFTLYDGETSTTVLWNDTFVDVDVVEGFFTVYLGSDTTLDFTSLISNSEIWVGITVESDPEMDRFQLASVPFALEALVCQQVGSLTEADINSNFMLTSSPAGSITTTNIANWNTAYGWGNHSGLYAPVSHNHDAAYVNVTGDTMTGNLNLSGNFMWGGAYFAAGGGNGYMPMGALIGTSCSAICATHSALCTSGIGPVVIPGGAATTCTSTTGDRLCFCYNL